MSCARGPLSDRKYESSNVHDDALQDASSSFTFHSTSLSPYRNRGRIGFMYKYSSYLETCYHRSSLDPGKLFR